MVKYAKEEAKDRFLEMIRKSWTYHRLYEDTSKRFHIIKAWDRIYGNHWQLHDRAEEDYYKGLYHENSLLDCKLKAEAIK